MLQWDRWALHSASCGGAPARMEGGGVLNLLRWTIAKTTISMQSHGADTSSQDICVAPVAFGERKIGPSILSHGVWLRWPCRSDASSVEVAAALLARSASGSSWGPSLEALGSGVAWKPVFFVCVFQCD